MDLNTTDLIAGFACISDFFRTANSEVFNTTDFGNDRGTVTVLWLDLVFFD